MVEGNASEGGRMQHPNFFPGWGGHLVNVHKAFSALYGAVLFEPLAMRWKMLIGCRVSPAGVPVLVVAGVVACCCWRMKM